MKWDPKVSGLYYKVGWTSFLHPNMSTKYPFLSTYIIITTNNKSTKFTLSNYCSSFREGCLVGTNPIKPGFESKEELLSIKARIFGERFGCNFGLDKNCIAPMFLFFWDQASSHMLVMVSSLKVYFQFLYLIKYIIY